MEAYLAAAGRAVGLARRGSCRVAAAAFVSLIAGVIPLSGQGGVEPSSDQVTQALATEWTANLQPTGQPVIPLFEGWFENPDGSYSLCFGYQNLNTEASLDIPLGPNNLIEPVGYDGMQPTHFDPVPGPELEYARRHWCVFTVRVPEDFGSDRVVWSLRIRGEDYSVPGHLGSPNYELDELEHYTRSGVAPTIQLGEDRVEGRGRNGIIVGPLRTRVGEALSIPVRVDPRPAESSLVWWFKHQGPGEVAFSRPQAEVGEEGGEVTTTATFAEPGAYLLRVQAVEDVGELEFHCCWTNGYVRVEVSP